MTFAGDAAAALPVTLGSPTVRTVAAFTAIFIVVLLLLAIAGMLLARLFHAAGLGVPDRILGAVFGFARGALILMLVVFAAAFTPLPQEPLWRESRADAGDRRRPCSRPSRGCRRGWPSACGI